jgi:alpha-tubulin suppressor-like RCC1 family protein
MGGLVMKLSIVRFAFLPALLGFSLGASFPSLTHAAGAVAAGDGSAAAIATGGQLATWGRNDVGQLGHSTGETPVILPRAVGVLSSWTKVSAGSRFMVALGDDGRLYAWGDNTAGQLGDGSLATSRTAPAPVALPEGATIRDFAAGESHVVALLDLPGQPGVLRVGTKRERTTGPGLRRSCQPFHAGPGWDFRVGRLPASHQDRGD